MNKGAGLLEIVPLNLNRNIASLCWWIVVIRKEATDLVLLRSVLMLPHVLLVVIALTALTIVLVVLLLLLYLLIEVAYGRISDRFNVRVVVAPTR